MGLFVKTIKCPKCKSKNYEKLDLENESGGVSGVVMNAFDVGGRSRLASSTALVKGNFQEYFKCSDCGAVYSIPRER